MVQKYIFLINLQGHELHFSLEELLLTKSVKMAVFSSPEPKAPGELIV